VFYTSVSRVISNNNISIAFKVTMLYVLAPKCSFKYSFQYKYCSHAWRTFPQPMWNMRHAWYIK